MAYILENLLTFSLITHNLQNFKPLFPIVLRIFDLECHGQASLKIAFVKFGHIFRKFRKLRSLHLENKNSVDTELSTFTISVPILCGKTIFKGSLSSMIYKIGVLKSFAEFVWKHLRSITLIKRDFSAGVFVRIWRNF